MDYYEVLHVNHDATAEEIKRAYRNLSKAFHPDAGGDHKSYTRITEAYSVLGDPDKRAQYDKTGSVDEDDADAVVYSVAIEYFQKAYETEPEDISAWIIKLIEQDTESLRAQNGQIERQIWKADRMLSRIIKAPDRDFAGEFIKQHRNRLLERQSANTTHVVMLSAVREVFSDYEFANKEHGGNDLLDYLRENVIYDR